MVEAPESRDLKRRAITFYNRIDPKKWGSDEQTNKLDDIDRWLQRYATFQSRVLDLGCGKGSLAPLGRRYQYIGLDLAFEPVRRFSYQSTGLQGDMEAVPIRSGAVQCVVTVNALEHAPHPEVALAEIDRVLAPGGVAYLHPSWFCRPWAADALPIRPYRDLSLWNKARKAAIPLRNSVAWRSLFTFPRRGLREIRFFLASRPLPFRYRRLRPNLDEYIYTDCDAQTSMDPHEAALYFRSRRYDVLNAPSLLRRFFLRHQALVVRKPIAAGKQS